MTPQTHEAILDMNRKHGRRFYMARIQKNKRRKDERKSRKK